MKKITILIILGFLFSCKKSMNLDQPKYVNQINYKSTEQDFYNFKHILDSDYSFDINITEIVINKYNNIFEVKKDKYSKADKIDGTSITIKFDIKNPYNRLMRVPFPDYFELGTKNYEELGRNFVSIKEDFYMNNQFTIQDSIGNYLSSFSTEEVLDNYKQTIVEFKPYETKSIVIKFNKPFPSTIKQVLFVGFDKYIKKKSKDLYSMTEEEKKFFSEDESLNYGLLIDLETKKIIDIKSLSLR